MDLSEYVRQVILIDQSPAAEEYLHERIASCFVDDPNQCRLTFVRSKGSETYDEDPQNKLSGDPFNKPNPEIVLSNPSIDEIKQNLKLSTASTLFIYITQRNSLSRLNVTFGIFTALVSEIQASAQLYDFVCCFGLRNGENELSPPRIRFHWLGPASRSTRPSFECIYILKFVELNHRHENNPWSIRQAQLYHQHREDSQRSVWLLISASPSMRRQIGHYLAANCINKTQDPFAIHLLVLNVVVGTWRRYLIYIAEEVRQQGDRAIAADFEGDGAQLARLEEGQYLKQLEDMITDLLSALNSTLETCNTLIRHHNSLRSHLKLNRLSHGNASDEYLEVITEGLREKANDLKHHRLQADSLRTKIRSASALVANILDLDNGNALKVLAIESRAENAIMHALTEKATRDAAAVKVLTIVTLVYLPTTAVLNFFSTSFVNFASNDSGSSEIVFTKDWWISIVISLPLTGVTLYIWWFYVQKQVNGQYPGWWVTLSECTRRLRGCGRGPGRGRTDLQTDSMFDRELEAR